MVDYKQIHFLIVCDTSRAMIEIAIGAMSEL